jgi:hypothetical protein
LALDRGSLPREFEKSRLKGIFGIGLVNQDAATNRKYLRTVTLNQCTEGVIRINLISAEVLVD